MFLLVDTSLKFLLIYNTSLPLLPTLENVISLFLKCHLFLDESGSFLLRLFRVLAGCLLVVSSNLPLCPSCFLETRQIRRPRSVTSDVWPEAFVDGGAHALWRHILTSSRLSFDDVTIDQWLTLPFLMNSLLPSLFPSL